MACVGERLPIWSDQDCITVRHSIPDLGWVMLSSMQVRYQVR
jgi:hypothetical protein